MHKLPLTLLIRRYFHLFKEGGWIASGQISSVLGSLVLVRVLTERLAPTEYGQLALGLTIAGLVNATVMGGVNNGIGRYYSIAAEKQDLPNYLRASSRLMVYATLAVVAIGSMLMIGLLWFGYSQWIGLVVAVLIFSLLNSYNSSLSNIQNAARQRVVVAFHGGLNAWLKIGLVLGMLLWVGRSSTSVVIGYALSSLLVTGSQFCFLHRLIPKRMTNSESSAAWIQQIWTYSWPFMTWGIFGWAQQSSTRWALEIFSTTSDVGLFSVLSQLGYTPIQTITNFAVAFLSPILFVRAGDASSSTRRKNIRTLTGRLASAGLVTIGCAFLAAHLLHSYLFNLFVSEDYLSVSVYLPWMVLSGGIFAIAQIYAVKLQALLLTKKLIIIGIGISIVGIISSFVGTYVAGLLGAILGGLFFSITYLVAITRFVTDPLEDV